jgi:DNA-binding IclR family transcriptional regulator
MQMFSFRKLVQLIREEFEQAPDLRITVGEAARFWGLDLQTCERVLTELLRAGFLALGADARYQQTTQRIELAGRAR